MPNIMRSLLRISSRNIIVNNCRSSCTIIKRSCFFKSDRKNKYPIISDYHDEANTPLKKMRQGWSFLRTELGVLKNEIKEALHFDNMSIIPPGEVDVEWRFEGDPKILDQWVVTSDSDYGEGKSVASLRLTKTGRGIFSGNLNPTTIRDGKVKRTGYCNVTSVKKCKSFQRAVCLNWGPYTHVVLRVRGDGRNYLLILSTPGEFDILWNDSYQYILHTRGGPYWQYVRIPFSKFFLVSHGRVQDNQCPVETSMISTIGITTADKIPGNFKLEIDYIGVECDPAHVEKHAYETYKAPHKFVV